MSSVSHDKKKEISSWKTLLLQWINCTRLLNQHHVSIESTDIEAFFAEFKTNIKEVDITDYDNTIQFLSTFYPQFKPHLDDTNQMSTTDYVYTYSLFLHFCCLKYKETKFQEFCNNLDTQCQIAFQRFLLTLMNKERLNKETLRAAIKGAAPSIFNGEDIEMNGGSIHSPTKSKQELVSPPTPRTSLLEEKTKQVYMLKALLDTERYERNCMEEQLEGSNKKVKVLETDLKRLIAQLRDFQNSMSYQNKENSAPNARGDMLQIKMLQKQIVAQDDVIADLKMQLNAIQEDKDVVVSQLKSTEAVLKEANLQGTNLTMELEETRCSNEKQAILLRELQNDNTELHTFINELRAAKHNDLNSTGDMLEMSFTKHNLTDGQSFSIGSPENLAKSVIDVQLREVQRAHQLLLDQMHENQLSQENVGSQLNELNSKWTLNLNNGDSFYLQLSSVVAALDSQLDDYKSKYLTMEGEVEALRKDVCRQSELVASTQQRYESSKQWSETLETTVKELENKIGQCESDKSILKRRLETSAHEFENLTKESEFAINALRQTLEEQIAAKNVAQNDLEAFKKEATQQLEAVQMQSEQRVHQLEADSKTIESELKMRHSQVVDELQETIQKLSASLKNVSDLNTSKDKEINDLQLFVSNTTEELTNTHSALEEIKHQLITVRDEFEAKLNEFNEICDQKDGIELELLSFKTVHQQNCEELEALHFEQKTAKSQLEEHLLKILKLEQEKQNLVLELEEKSLVVDELHSELDDKSRELVALNEDMANLGTDFEDKIVSLKTERETLREEVNVCKTKLTDFDVRIVDLIAEKDKLIEMHQSEVESMVNQHNKIIVTCEESLNSQVNEIQTKLIKTEGELSELILAKENILEKHELELEELKQIHQNILATSEESSKTALSEYKSNLAAAEETITAIQAEKEALSNESENKLAEANVKITEITNEFVKEIAYQKSELEKTLQENNCEIQRLVQSHQEEVQKINQTHQEIVDSSEKSFQSKLSDYEMKLSAAEEAIATIKAEKEALSDTSNLKLTTAESKITEITSELEKIIGEQKSELENMVQTNKSEMVSLAESHQFELEKIKNSHQEYVKSVEVSHTEVSNQRQMQVSELNEKLNCMKEQLEASIHEKNVKLLEADATISELTNKIEELIAHHKSEVQNMNQISELSENETQTKLTSMNSEVNKLLSEKQALIEAHKSEMVELEQVHSQTVAQIKTEKETLAENHRKEVETIKQLHNSSEESLKGELNEYKTKLCLAEEKIEMITVSLEASSEENNVKLVEAETKVAELITQMQEITSNHQSEIVKMNQEFTVLEMDLQAKLVTLETQLNGLQSEKDNIIESHKCKLDEMGQEHNGIVAQLETEKKNLVETHQLLMEERKKEFEEILSSTDTNASELNKKHQDVVASLEASMGKELNEYKTKLFEAEEKLSTIAAEREVNSSKLKRAEARILEISKEMEEIIVSHQTEMSEMKQESERLRSSDLQLYQTNLETSNEKMLEVHAKNEAILVQVEQNKIVVDELSTKFQLEVKKIEEDYQNIASTLQESVINYSTKLLSAEEKIAKITAEQEASISSSDIKLSEAVSQIAEIKSEMEQVIANHQLELENLQHDNEVKLSTMEDMLNEIQTEKENLLKVHNSKLSDIEATHNQMLSQIEAEKQCLISSHQSELEKTKQIHQDVLYNTVQPLKNSLTEYQTKLIAAEHTIETLALQCGNKDEYAQKLVEIESKNKELIDEMQRITAIHESEMEKLHQSNISLLQDLESKIATMTAQINDNTSEREVLIKTLSDKELFMDAQKNELVQLKHIHSQTMCDAERLQKLVKVMELKLQTLEAADDAVKNSETEAKNEIKRLKEAKVELQKSAQLMEKQTQEQVEKLTRDNAILQAKLMKHRQIAESKEAEWKGEREQLLVKVANAKTADEQIKENRLELEGKLEKMKDKMKNVYQEETRKTKFKFEREISDLRQDSLQSSKKIDQYELHVQKLSKQMFQMNERQLDIQKENEYLKNKLRLAEHNAGSTSNSLKPHARPFCKMEDEEGEQFNNTYLTDLKSGGFERSHSPMGRESVRLSELQWRNSIQLPHLRSTYLAQYGDQELREDDVKTPFAANNDLDDSLSSLLQSGQRKKIGGTTSYKRPGPPTPSKNAGRLSFGGSVADIVHPREVFKDTVEEKITKKTSTTPGKLRSIFSSSASASNKTTKDENTPRSRLSIFRGRNKY